MKTNNTTINTAHSLFILFPFLLSLSLLAGCSGKSGNSDIAANINPDRLQIHKIEFTQNFNRYGYLMGTAFEEGEIYIKSGDKAQDNHVIEILDLHDGKIKEQLTLNRGSFQSPVDFFNPSYVQSLDGRKIVIDQFHKIIVFDEGLRRLYTNMFLRYRSFIDFFTLKHKTYFVLASRKNNGNGMFKCNVTLYKMPENRPPVFLKTISEEFMVPSVWEKTKKNKGKCFNGFFWPTLYAFEKDGVIYYSSGDSREIKAYSPGTGKLETIKLGYLQPKVHTNEEAHKFGLYRSDGWEEKFYKDTGAKMVYEAFPGKIYHYGFYDVGKGKVGVMGHLNLETMTIRLDIIDINRRVYEKSLLLPMGTAWKETISAVYRGYCRVALNVDQKVYIRVDLNDEDNEDMVKISRFKVLE